MVDGTSWYSVKNTIIIKLQDYSGVLSSCEIRVPGSLGEVQGLSFQHPFCYYGNQRMGPGHMMFLFSNLSNQHSNHRNNLFPCTGNDVYIDLSNPTYVGASCIFPSFFMLPRKPSLLSNHRSFQKLTSHLLSPHLVLCSFYHFMFIILLGMFSYIFVSLSIKCKLTGLQVIRLKAKRSQITS